VKGASRLDTESVVTAADVDPEAHDDADIPPAAESRDELLE
jgi:hypothetical protein